MNHGVVDVFAFQEALFIEALFGIALLWMLWAGFRRWLQYKEKHDARLEKLETRLNALEQAPGDAGQAQPMLEGVKLPSGS